MIAVQERVDDEDALQEPVDDKADDQQSNTSREGGKKYFNQMIAVQEQVDDEDALQEPVDDKADDQQSNTSTRVSRTKKIGKP